MLACAFVAASASARPPGGDEGRFVVTRVLIDPALDNNEQRYYTDDPRFLGRYVTTTRERVAIDGGLPCAKVQRSFSRGTVAGLLKAKLQHRSPGGRAFPTPAEMKFPPYPAQQLELIEYRCIAADTGRPGGVPGHEWNGVTNFPLSAGRRGLIWEGEVVLVIDDAATVAPPKPSFDCKTASTTTEVAICHSPVLASWDRSVGFAFNRLRHGGGADGIAPVDDAGALIASQRRWIAERGRCGADTHCLEDRMYERTDALMRDQY